MINVNKDDYEFEHRNIVRLTCLFVTCAGLGLVILSAFLDTPFTKDVLLGLGLALGPAGALALIGDYLIFGRTMEALKRSNRSLRVQVRALERQVSSLRTSTDFLAQSDVLGLQMVYENRGAALRDFVQKMRDQAQVKGRNGRLLITGSSIKGLREKVRDFDDILRNAFENDDCTLRILLTHPSYSRGRESQEGRSPGDIENEVLDSLRFVENIWAKSVKRDTRAIHDIVRLYKGTPTCFMIVAGNSMLINPYPYEKEAFKSFCLGIVKSTASDPEGIFQQFFASHFESPWRHGLPFSRFLLEGPIPEEAWDKARRYGDLFVIQDAGEFYLAVCLTGTMRSSILGEESLQGVPASVPFLREADHVKQSLHLGDEFFVRLLPIQNDPTLAEWCDFRPCILRLDSDRCGKASGTFGGNLMNEYEMVGLFGPIDSPFVHKDFARKALRGKPLPLFYHWIEKPGLPHAVPADGRDAVGSPVVPSIRPTTEVGSSEGETAAS